MTVKTAARGAGDGRPAEVVLELQRGKGWRRRPASITLRGSQVTFSASRVLREPLTVPAGLLELVAVERDRERPAEHGRFVILHRISAASVLPAQHGVEGWLWTSRAGSALPSLAEDADAPPNVALLFAKPLGADQVARCFEPDWVRALADRSPLGVPAVAGLLAVAADPATVHAAFGKLGLLSPITDREIPPTMRRHLDGDKPVNVRVPVNASARAGTSVAPPATR